MTDLLDVLKPAIRRAAVACAALLVPCLLVALSGAARASVVPVAAGYEVSYALNLPEGATPPGQNINSVFIFEWNASQRSADFPYTILGRGQTTLSHVIPFRPDSAFVIGFIDPVPGAAPGSDDAKRHLYTLVDPAFSDYLVQNRLGVLFSQLFGQGEQYTIDQMVLAAQGSQTALDGLWSFVTTAMADAAFDPDGEFRVHKWSTTTPPIPQVPVPAGIVLVLVGMAGLAWTGHRKK